MKVSRQTFNSSHQICHWRRRWAMELMAAVGAKLKTTVKLWRMVGLSCFYEIDFKKTWASGLLKPLKYFLNWVYTQIPKYYMEVLSLTGRMLKWWFHFIKSMLLFKKYGSLRIILVLAVTSVVTTVAVLVAVVVEAIIMVLINVFKRTIMIESYINILFQNCDKMFKLSFLVISTIIILKRKLRQANV